MTAAQEQQWREEATAFLRARFAALTADAAPRGTCFCCGFCGGHAEDCDQYRCLTRVRKVKG